MKALNALIKTDESITAVIDGIPKTMTCNHPSFTEALTCLATGEIDILDSLFDVSESITRKFNADNVGGVEITDGVIYYNGTPVHGRGFAVSAARQVPYQTDGESFSSRC